MEKLNRIKILVLDLDRTIIKTMLGSISKEDIQSIINVQKKGIKIILNTGRCIKNSLWVSKLLELKKYNGLIIALNGSVIFDPKTNKKIVLNELNKEQKKILLFANKQTKISIIFFPNNPNQEGFIYKRTFLLFLFSIFKKTLRFNLIPESEILKKKISSSVIIGSFKKIQKFINIVSKNSEKISFSSGLKHTAQISLSDKKKGLDYILEKFNINVNDVMIIGDNKNDLPLFINFKYTIAMGNAIPEIKSKSFFITKTCSKNGVSYAINKFLL